MEIRIEKVANGYLVEITYPENVDTFVGMEHQKQRKVFSTKEEVIKDLERIL